MYLPTISIVTPSFNQAEYLEECIESILAQGYPKLEYVIMDGGSTDGSVEIIKKYEKYLTYWQSCSDGGQYQAITEGFRHTSGEIMAWLNSDDKYHPLAFTKVTCVLKDHPEVSWLTGRKSFWDAAGNLTQVDDKLAVFSRRKFLEGHFSKPYIQQESTFWRRLLWEQAGACLKKDAVLAGDLELWCRFFRYAPLYTIDTLLGGYRFHDGQRGAVHADEYLRESSAFVVHEQQICKAPLDSLPVPPNHLLLTKGRLASFVDAHDVRPHYPNRTTCWCEYTEDLIAITSKKRQERWTEVATFWLNEAALFSLAKPRAAWLLADNLENMELACDQLKTLLNEGGRCEESSQYRDAIGCYRKALALSPFSSTAGQRLLRCLWDVGERAEALGYLPSMLEYHAHDAGLVQVAVTILIGCGAYEQARGVCDEYLMVNPHDVELSALRHSLERA